VFENIKLADIHNSEIGC